MITELLAIVLAVGTTMVVMLATLAWWREPSTRSELRRAVAFSALAALAILTLSAFYVYFVELIDHSTDAQALYLTVSVVVAALYGHDVVRGLRRLRAGEGGEHD